MILGCQTLWCCSHTANCVCCFITGVGAMRGCVWSFRALSPALLPPLLSRSRCCRSRAVCHDLQSSVQFFSTAPEAQVAPLPSQARVVICGGGIVGTSVAYHLAKLGWTEVVLLEQGRWMSCNMYGHTGGVVPIHKKSSIRPSSIAFSFLSPSLPHRLSFLSLMLFHFLSYFLSFFLSFPFRFNRGF